MIYRLSRVVRGLWNYYILQKRPTMLDLTEMDRELSTALREWDMEFTGRRTQEPVSKNRYVWKKTTWFVLATWQLLDIETDLYVGEVTRWGRHEYSGAHKFYRSRRSAMNAVEYGVFGSGNANDVSPVLYRNLK